MRPFLILAALLAVSPAYSAHDQQVCGPRHEAVEQLALKYNEHAIGAGLSARGFVLEIYVSEKRNLDRPYGPARWDCLPRRLWQPLEGT